MINEIFKFKKANTVKMNEYGFLKVDGGYRYETAIINGQFTLVVFVSNDGGVSTKTVDNEFKEEYTLHLINGSEGEFVGKVRAEYERILTDICDKCYEKNVFKSEQAREIIEYVSVKYGDEFEYLWEKFPTNAVVRRKDNSKWYAVLLVVSKRKLGVDSDELVEILDIRCRQDKLPSMIDNRIYFAGYHMNKKHWITVYLDGGEQIGTILNYLDESYDLAK